MPIERMFTLKNNGKVGQLNEKQWKNSIVECKNVFCVNGPFSVFFKVLLLYGPTTDLQKAN